MKPRSNPKIAALEAAVNDYAGPKHGEAVIIYFDQGAEDFDAFLAYEQTLVRAVQAAGIGEWDGHETALEGADGSIFFYGQDADEMFAVLRPMLARGTFLGGVKVLLSGSRSPAGDYPRQVVENLSLH